MRRGTWALVLGSTVFYGLVFVGCDEFLNPKPYNGPPGLPPSSDGGTGDADADGGVYGACGDCVEYLCSSEWTACLQSPECNAIRDCVAVCGSEARCTQACIAQYPDGGPAYRRVLDCSRYQACTTCRPQCQPTAAYCNGS